MVEDNFTSVTFTCPSLDFQAYFNIFYSFSSSILTVGANLGTVCEILLDVIPTLEDVS